MILGQSQEHGRISLGRLMMFEHLFDFGKTHVKEIMTPRSSIACVLSGRTWPENLAMMRERKYSRYPLARTGPDDIFGFVHFKDLTFDFLDCSAKCENPDLEKIKRDMHSISEDVTAEKALREFQEKRMHIALTRNGKGAVTGLLSIEDIIEELTGELRDEFEQPPRLTLSRLLVKDACKLQLAETSRFEAIREVLERLHAAAPSFDKEEAFKAIIKRENNFSTALGHQTAFPHARLQDLSRPLVAIGKSDQGIFFPSPDNQPVKVIFLILTPFNEPTLQLNILAQLSGLVSNLTLRKRLLSAKNSDNLMDIIRTFENKVMK